MNLPGGIAVGLVLLMHMAYLVLVLLIVDKDGVSDVALVVVASLVLVLGVGLADYMHPRRSQPSSEDDPPKRPDL